MTINSLTLLKLRWSRSVEVSVSPANYEATDMVATTVVAASLVEAFRHFAFLTGPRRAAVTD